MATVVIGRWVGELDTDQAERVLSGQDTFDERTMVDDHGDGEDGGDREPEGSRSPRSDEPAVIRV